ncbi:hypothetical protein L798_14874 [Zootermopsis nevadensis]|uniref:Seven-in-absentia protein TRAF-like domain-containing protein n=1 Tax=Zootermopsis nevadensis TaxID=136037 RepID=A0A067QP15_ZOONE|nr:hypothetical protein L798_14874 [Zootermopsis nevadensis]
MICLWFGTKDELAEHLRGAHSHLMVSRSFGCRATSTTMALILYKDEVFLYYKLITEDRNWHIFLQKAGITQQHFNYSITLSTGLPVNDSISTFSVTDISDKFECIYRNAFTCTHFAIEPYISGNEVNMTVTIEANSWD